MKIGIVQHGEDVIPKAREKLEGEIATLNLKEASSKDLLNVLSHTKSFLEECEAVMIFVELKEDEESLNSSFYNGLAHLHAETGKTIYKEIYTDMEEPEVMEKVEELIDDFY